MEANIDLFEKQQIKCKLSQDNDNLKQEIGGLTDQLISAFWQQYPPLQIVDHLQFTQEEISEWISKRAEQGRS